MGESIQDDLLNTAPCGFLVFSDDGTILAVNQTLSALLHFKEGELVGKNIESILTLANRIFYQTHLFPLIKLHGKADEIFLTLLSADKKDIHVLLNASRKTANGEATNHCIFVPVQQRRKYENELLLAKKAAEEALTKNEILLETQRMLEVNKQEMDRQVSKLTQMNRELMQFSKVISHDIQEPIRKIAVFTDLALMQVERQSDEIFKNALEKISFSCQRMRKLVNSLEQYITLESNEKSSVPVDLNLAVEKAKNQALASTGYSGAISLEYSALPVLSGKRRQMEMLFFNLIENAIKFRHPDRSVHIHISATLFQENSYKSIQESYHYQDVVRISFTDNGKGFDTDHSSNLFQLFQKLHSDSLGTGLGLALCKKIVDNHYGEISFHSTPGEGTSFDIILPL